MSALPAAAATPSPGNTPRRIRRLSGIYLRYNLGSFLELLPHSTAGSGGIDIEEEARLFDELCRTSKQHLPPVPQYRRFSPPPPSVVSSDIFLADNTGESPRSFAQDVRIPGWTSVGDAPPSSGVKKSLQAVADGSGSAFIVYDCVITTKEGTTIHILKRYTSFVELDTALRRTLPRHLLPSIPILPPKNPLARFRPAFLDHRRRLLQYWLANVLLHPEVGGSEVVKKWVIQ
ncbi:hypothetical protein AGABI1DRAFT_123205 [Agaricus bisporus var. burnettii JB137-S8]|uniref:Endosomal/vacuolar adapter protein YPT35 n=1 Tax=Agaricus bisporus var. burnettii (strain JB137-S8 / ATCC MYA-4627 / FGSC 10392) TaxID=597362 RepID=K5WJH5_AGABU|nr:uncharacterized protein AGABI1DRAFT_123205 [Agaricus bisporus var. burnettii JB137-S8]EKM75456.1 hypothetical protein AGABI1DRAFT_123205 [Agaricus bisporus var. burnettii JB137-S8]